MALCEIAADQLNGVEDRISETFGDHGVKLTRGKKAIPRGLVVVGIRVR